MPEAALDLLLTTGRQIRYQQNLAGRRIAVVVLTGTTKWSRVRLHVERIAAAVNAATPGSYTEIEIPFS
jgi:hypothetical protein